MCAIIENTELNLLFDLQNTSSAIGQLVLVYKRVTALAGFTSRVSELLESVSVLFFLWCSIISTLNLPAEFGAVSALVVKKVDYPENNDIVLLF